MRSFWKVELHSGLQKRSNTNKKSKGHRCVYSTYLDLQIRKLVAYEISPTEIYNHKRSKGIENANIYSDLKKNKHVDQK